MNNLHKREKLRNLRLYNSSSSSLGSVELFKSGVLSLAEIVHSWMIDLFAPETGCA